MEDGGIVRVKIVLAECKEDLLLKAVYKKLRKLISQLQT